MNELERALKKRVDEPPGLSDGTFLARVLLVVSYLKFAGLIGVSWLDILGPGIGMLVGILLCGVVSTFVIGYFEVRRRRKRRGGE